MGSVVNHKRIERLYKKMGLQTICPKKDLSKRNKAYPVYPYLLKDLVIDRPNRCGRQILRISLYSVD
ncbi:IS3 family transposase [Chryseobacterium soli]|uniref:IS3 family transposase n=1 Tax=Chryseobacterium soli TaxID=445961 RepID=UPI0009FC1C96